jgi:hypothetical protein
MASIMEIFEFVSKSSLEIVEHRAGVEPANAGFADLCVSHFATGALLHHHLVTNTERGSFRSNKTDP